jgi:hypothetical protein
VESDRIALTVVLMTACVIVLDGWKLLHARKHIPNIGRFPTGGMAWRSDVGHEFVRNAIMLGTIAVMAVAPWFIAERSHTSQHWVIIFDVILSIHGLWLLVPKRYAITRDALWVDGFRVDWNRLWWTGHKPGSLIVLQRKGWWRLAPIPLGGEDEDLTAAALRIDAVMAGEWETLLELLAEEE